MYIWILIFYTSRGTILAPSNSAHDRGIIPVDIYTKRKFKREGGGKGVGERVGDRV